MYKIKKTLSYTLLCGSMLGLAGCSLLPTQKTENTVKTTQSSTVKEDVSDEKRAEKDAKIVLNAVLSDTSAGFSSLMGENVREWKEKYTEEYVDDNVNDYQPAEDYTITIGTETFTPEDILRHFDETRWELLATIGTDYEINNVEIDGDEATITFTSRGLATLDLANSINLIKTNLFADGLAGVSAAADSTDPVIKRANDMLNNFLFYWCFDRENLDFGYASEREMTLILEREGDRWVITDDNLLELKQQLFVQEYSEDGAELRSENTSTKNNG